jgi:CRP-like cAMP-binding protein
MEEPTAELRAIPIFGELDDAALAGIWRLFTPIEVAAGHVLIEAGQAGSGMFILEEGSVTVEIPGAAPIALGPGEYVGELAILGPDIVRTARVQAATPVRALAISRANFWTLLHEEPRIAVAMLPGLARRLADVETGA